MLWILCSLFGQRDRAFDPVESKLGNFQLEKSELFAIHEQGCDGLSTRPRLVCEEGTCHSKKVAGAHRPLEY